MLGVPGLNGATPCDLGVRAVEARLASLLSLDLSSSGSSFSSATATSATQGGDAERSQADLSQRRGAAAVASRKVLEGLARLRPDCREANRGMLELLQTRFSRWQAAASALG